MDIILSKSSDKPIYEQISSQIKSQVLSGALATGERLPSIRALADGLGVSVITTKRAYADLEADGLIETVQGRAASFPRRTASSCARNARNTSRHSSRGHASRRWTSG